jgi:hypothetical protein
LRTISNQLHRTPLFRDYADFTAAVNDPGFDLAYNFIEPRYGNLFGIAPQGASSMHPIEDVVKRGSPGQGCVRGDPPLTPLGRRRTDCPLRRARRSLRSPAAAWGGTTRTIPTDPE